MDVLRQSRNICVSSGLVRVREYGSGLPVVLLHGIVANGLVWRKVACRLGPGVRCIVPDLPLGSHLPPLPDADLTLPGLARLTVELLDALDVDEAVLVGNGYGGDIAQVVASTYPGRVSGLVLVATNAFDSDPWPTKVLKMLTGRPGATFLQSFASRFKVVQRLPITYGAATKRPIAPEIMAEFLAPLQKNRLVRNDFRRFLEGLSPDYLAAHSAKLVDFGRPALVVWPRDEAFFPADGARRLAETLSNGELVYVDDSRAWAPEDNPEQLADHLASFLRQYT